MTGPAYRALKKAWGGYKASRVEAREAHDEAEHYARVINGIRAVNGQDPLDFEKIEKWEGGRLLPQDPTEEFPAPDHPGGDDRESLEEAADHGHAAGVVQSTIEKFRNAAHGDPYDPTKEFREIGEETPDE
jgi:hypothetical protein